MSWPEGIGTALRLDGRCRDLRTERDNEPVVIAETVLRASLSPDRTIETIASDPPEPRLVGLVGARGGSNLRSVLDEVVPDQRAAGTPLALLLDDVAGASLIAGFVWIRWADRLPELAERRKLVPPRRMEGICSGFRPGSSALLPDGTISHIPHATQPVPPLVDHDDPIGWHQLGGHPAMAMRRARRIDVWIEQDDVVIDAMFRDSSWEPDGMEIAVHEYQLHARASRYDGTLTVVEAVPRVLPYGECPGAAPHAARLAGAPLRELRTRVLEELRGTECCTHLNDALRALAEVPVLVDMLTIAPPTNSESGEA